MSRVISLVLIALCVLLGLAFAVVNAKPVELNYFIATREVPLAMVLVLSIVLGALMGFVFSLGMVIRLKRETYRLRRQLQVAGQEVVNLRTIPIKDTR